MPNRYPSDDEALIEQILVDANGEAEGMTAFYEELRGNVGFPQVALVAGRPLSVHEVDYDGLFQSPESVFRRCGFLPSSHPGEDREPPRVLSDVPSDSC